MQTSRIGVVIDALIAMFGTALDGVTVLDGPESTDMGSLHEYVVVGDELDDETGSESTFTQTWAGLGAHAKTESGSVLCSIAVQAGDSDAQSLRDRRNRALAILGVCETAQRADINLGGLVLFSAIENGSYRPVSNADGTGALVTFTVTYEARI